MADSIVDNIVRNVQKTTISRTCLQTEFMHTDNPDTIINALVKDIKYTLAEEFLTKAELRMDTEFSSRAITVKVSAYLLDEGELYNLIQLAYNEGRHAEHSRSMREQGRR